MSHTNVKQHPFLTVDHLNVVITREKTCDSDCVMGTKKKA